MRLLRVFRGGIVYKPGQRVTDPQTGKRGKVVFISPINHRVYVEFDRKIPFVTYLPEQLSSNLFGDLT